MKYVIVYFVWFVGVLTVGKFWTVLPASADEFDGLTTASHLNVRTGPGVTHEAVTSVPKGTQVAILDVSDGWVHVAANDGVREIQGWVSANFVDLYQVALPEVASAGLEDDQLAQANPSALTSDPLEGVTPDTAVLENSLEVQLAEDTEIPSDTPVAPTVEIDLPTVEVVAARVTEPASSPADKSVSEETLDLAAIDTTDDLVDGGKASELKQSDTDEVVAASQGADPIVYEPIDILCRRAYFSDTLETCTADIRVGVSVPESIGALVSDSLDLSCDVGFDYEAGGQRFSQIATDRVKVALSNGKGSSVLVSRVEFLFQDDNITRVEIGNIECVALSALN